MLVSELMATPAVAVPIDRSLREAVERMLADRIGSVVVTEDGNHVGIVTETDVVRAGYRMRRPFKEIPVAEAASRPLITIDADATVRAAVERMHEERIKKLGVADGLDLLGIVTHQDVVYRHPDLVKEAIQHAEPPEEWGGRDGT